MAKVLQSGTSSARANDSFVTGTTVYMLLKFPGDARAWAVFVERYGPMIYSWCRRWGLQEADAENVGQEVLTLLFQKLKSFDRDKGRFRNWLKTVTKHAWSDYCQKQRRSPAGAGDSEMLQRLHTVEAGDDLAGRIEKAFDRELFEQAQAQVRSRVADDTWEAFRLLAVEGLSGAEAAARLQMKITTVFVARCRVQKMLHEELQRLEAAAGDGA